MSRTPPDPSARLGQLEAARKAIGRKKVRLNAQEMAAAVGMTWVALKKHIEKSGDASFGSGIVTRGSEGIPWVFDAAKTLDHMIGQARAAQADRERRRAEVSRLAGFRSPGAGQSPAGSGGQAAEPGTAASPRDMLEDARALEKLIDIQAKLRSERVRQGLLLEREDVERFLWRWLSGLQAEVLAIENRVDKAGRLDGPVRQALKDELAGILVNLRARLETYLGTGDVSDDGSDRGRPEPARRRRLPRKDGGPGAASAGAAHPA